MPTMTTVDKASLARSVCTESFHDFFLQFWDTIIAEPLSDNWHLKVLCDEIQYVADRAIARKPKEYDLIINVPPGSTKSTIASAMLPAYCWAKDPTIRTICGCYAQDLSMDLAGRTRRILLSEKYRSYFPKVNIVSEGKAMMETSRGGQRIGCSVGGRITGLHAHIQVIDDPLNPKEAASDLKLKGANDWIDQTLRSRKVAQWLTPMILVMQRLHQNDPTGHLMEMVKAGVRIRHVSLPIDDSYEVRPRKYRACYRAQDGLFDPLRLPRSITPALRIELGDYGFAGQYGQSPIPPGGGMFRTAQLQIVPSPPPCRKVIRYWDKAGTSKGGAFTVGVKMGLCADRSYVVLDVIRGQWEASEREKIIKQTAIIDGKGVFVGVEQEPGSGGKESAMNTLKNLAGWRVKVDPVKGDKELRADPYAVQVNGGNVKMVRAGWNDVYLNELQFFPFSKYKDQVDASSGAFATLAKAGIMVGAF